MLITDPVADRGWPLAAAQGAETVTGDDPAQAVIDATDGEGADVVIDAAGYEATWAMGLRAVRSGGRIDEVGLGSGSGTVDFFAVLGKEATITGSYAWGDADFARAVELLDGRTRSTSTAGSRRCRSPTASARSKSWSTAPATSRSCSVP